MRAGRIGNELGLTLSGIDNQLNMAAKNRDVAKSVHTVNDPEYYGSFSDNGKKLAYEQAATEAEMQASRNLTSDAYQNRLFKKAASSEARNLRLQGNLIQSEAYSTPRRTCVCCIASLSRWRPAKRRRAKLLVWLRLTKRWLRSAPAKRLTT